MERWADVNWKSVTFYFPVVFLFFIFSLVKPALDKMPQDEREQLVKEKKVFKLMFMPPNAIMKLHQNDFPNFTFHKLSLEEVILSPTLSLRPSLPLYSSIIYFFL
jgi:hypothetical protein